MLQNMLDRIAKYAHVSGGPAAAAANHSGSASNSKYILRNSSPFKALYVFS
jgi:hypothetical protein